MNLIMKGVLQLLVIINSFCAEFIDQHVEQKFCRAFQYTTGAPGCPCGNTHMR